MGPTSKEKGGVQGRRGARVGKGKKEGGSNGKEGKREVGEEKGEGKKESGKGILAIPTLLCFRRRWAYIHQVYFWAYGVSIFGIFVLQAFRLLA